MRESAEILFALGNAPTPWEETYYFREASVREITTQKEEDRRREKRQRGTTDCGQHWTCALRWSLFPPRVTFLAFLHKEGDSFYARKVTHFYVPPWACSLVFLPHLMRHFSDVCQNCTQFYHLESKYVSSIHNYFKFLLTTTHLLL